jgi:hypothetical protein
MVKRKNMNSIRSINKRKVLGYLILAFIFVVLFVCMSFVIGIKAATIITFVGFVL